MVLTVTDNEAMIFLPQSIDFDYLKAKGNESIENFNLNNLKFIISSIILKSVFPNVKENVAQYEKESRISSKYWFKFLQKDYPRYIDLLLDEKIIFRKPYGERIFFGYAFYKKYEFSRIYAEVIYFEKYHSKIEIKYKNSYTKKYEKSLSNFFVKYDFSIDTEKVEKAIFDRYFETANYPLKISHGEPISKDLSAYSSYLLAMKKMVEFMNGEYSFSRYSKKLKDDGTGKKKYKTAGRYYNSYAYLNKEIRKNLIYKGKKLIEIDIKNCVPYLLSNYFKTINPRFSRVRLERISKNFSSHNMYFESPKTLMNKEIDEFNFLCIEGKIYDLFIEPLKNLFGDEWKIQFKKQFDIEYKNTYEHDRKLAKQFFISMIFGKISNYENIQVVFQSFFPILHDLITTEKRHGYKKLSRKLFELEGDIMIDNVAKPLIRIYKRKIPVFTVHDCIATTQPYIETVKTMIESVCMERFGNIPKIEIE